MLCFVKKWPSALKDLTPEKYAEIFENKIISSFKGVSIQQKCLSYVRVCNLVVFNSKILMVKFHTKKTSESEDQFYQKPFDW